MLDYRSNIVEYISGFTIKRLSQKIVCDTCRNCLITSKPDVPTLTTLKDYGEFLVYPSKDVLVICEICEKVIVIEVSRNNWLSKRFFFDYISLKIVKIVIESTDLADFDDHRYDLVKKIVSCYTCLRLKHHARLENQKLKKKKIRAKLSRLILNMNQ